MMMKFQCALFLLPISSILASLTISAPDLAPWQIAHEQVKTCKLEIDQKLSRSSYDEYIIEGIHSLFKSFSTANSSFGNIFESKFKTILSMFFQNLPTSILNHQSRNILSMGLCLKNQAHLGNADEAQVGRWLDGLQIFIEMCILRSEARSIYVATGPDGNAQFIPELAAVTGVISWNQAIELFPVLPETLEYDISPEFVYRWIGDHILNTELTQQNVAYRGGSQLNESFQMMQLYRYILHHDQANLSAIEVEKIRGHLAAVASVHCSIFIRMYGKCWKKQRVYLGRILAAILPGESMFVGSGHSKHATASRITREIDHHLFTITNYNTGVGIAKYHHSLDIDGKEYIIHSKSIRNVTLEELKDGNFLDNLNESIDEMYFDRTRRVLEDDDHLHWFQYGSEQRSGTCSNRSLMVLGRTILGHGLYHYVKTLTILMTFKIGMTIGDPQFMEKLQNGLLKTLPAKILKLLDRKTHPLHPKYVDPNNLAALRWNDFDESEDFSDFYSLSEQGSLQATPTKNLTPVKKNIALSIQISPLKFPISPLNSPFKNLSFQSPSKTVIPSSHHQEPSPKKRNRHDYSDKENDDSYLDDYDVSTPLISPKANIPSKIHSNSFESSLSPKTPTKKMRTGHINANASPVGQTNSPKNPSKTGVTKRRLFDFHNELDVSGVFTSNPMNFLETTNDTIDALINQIDAKKRMIIEEKRQAAKAIVQAIRRYQNLFGKLVCPELASWLQNLVDLVDEIWETEEQ